ncbi:hypothetical protein RHGRI_009547 [Rhododendron griersonianum]|uniref:Uncharacterized protein n=1 Tax=Rhododendron griersonianum TaxID=479676 RepID=A0AAV6KFF3_9ERIC|nr:hypothetical protein RHGRI_009547 [Rhododendron griersonianum]
MEGFALPPLCILSLLVFSILITSNAVDTITTTKSLADGETIVSSGGIFELGFFSPGNSTNRYVGIWYKKIPNTTVVWVANRETPLFDKAGVLKFTSPGILVLVNSTNDTVWIWSTKTSRSAQDPVAQLFDSGNMVVRNSDDEIKAENFLWQSFDYPGNTLLPGMKLGKNFLTGQEWYVSSWKSDDDPGQGVFTYVLDTHGYPQMFLRNGATDLYGSGPWNGLKFSGIQNPAPISRFYYNVSFNYDLNTDVVYYTYEVTNSSVVSRSVLSHEGYMTLWASFDQTSSWIAIGSVPKASCGSYAFCGSYGICNKNNSPVCGCLVKFVPKNPKEWKLHDWSNGCVRRTPLSCQQEGGEDGFVKYSRVKLPDTRNSSFDKRMSLEECRRTCLGNCSCMAYANLDIREAGSGCLLWFGDLIDIKEFIEGGGQDIYVRMASSESGYVNPTPKGRSMRWKWIITALAVSMTLLTTSFYYCIRRRKLKKKGKDLLSFDLGTSIGADNTTMTEAITSKSNGVDTITTTKSLADGETIVSAGEIFELGFFSPGTSKNRYVGIWYKSIPITTVVWVANRETPLFDTSGVLKLASPGILVLVNGTNDTIWSTNTSTTAQDPAAQLLDSGNMVVRNADDEMKAESLLWQSFDYPGNTLLPGMKLGKNSLTGQEWYFSSWKSDDDPGQGVFTLVLNAHGYPQMFIRNGTNDLSVLTHEGYITLSVWVDQTRSWLAMGSAPKAGCDMYASCGSYGICIINNSPMCECLDKFLPKYPKDWYRFDWSRGCVQRTPLGCHEGGEDGFVKYSRVKLPDTRNSWFDTRMSLEECRRTCLGNCSCMAYANLDIREAGTGCLLWFDNLIDFKEFIGGSGQDIYLRMASSESGGYVNSTPKGRNIKRKWIITASMTMLTTAFFYRIWRRKLQKKGLSSSGGGDPAAPLPTPPPVALRLRNPSLPPSSAVVSGSPSFPPPELLLFGWSTGRCRPCLRRHAWCGAFFSVLSPCCGGFGGSRFLWLPIGW